MSTSPRFPRLVRKWLSLINHNYCCLCHQALPQEEFSRNARYCRSCNRERSRRNWADPERRALIQAGRRRPDRQIQRRAYQNTRNALRKLSTSTPNPKESRPQC